MAMWCQFFVLGTSILELREIWFWQWCYQPIKEEMRRDWPWTMSAVRLRYRRENRHSLGQLVKNGTWTRNLVLSMPSMPIIWMLVSLNKSVSLCFVATHWNEFFYICTPSVPLVPICNDKQIGCELCPYWHWADNYIIQWMNCDSSDFRVASNNIPCLLRVVDPCYTNPVFFYVCL